MCVCVCVCVCGSRKREKKRGDKQIRISSSLPYESLC